MSGTLKVGGKTIATHDTNTNVAKIQLGSTSDVVITDSAGNNVLSESGGVVTLTADEANVGSNALVVNSSGNVGIGTSSPGAKLDVRTAAGTTAQLNLYTGSNATASRLQFAQIGAIAWNAGITATTGDFQIALDDGEIGYNIIRSGTAINYHSWLTSGSERMRIDSSGNVMIPGSSLLSSSILSVDGSGNVANGIASKVNDNAYWTYVGINPTGTNTFLVYGDGDVENTNNSYGAISDVKLKENIVDTTPKLDDLKQVRIVNYNLIENPDKKLLGVIAQELEQIFPNIVSETPDFDDEGNDLGTTTKSVKYSVFVPMLIKAMQEQQAIIESQQSQIDALTARIEALEATP